MFLACHIYPQLAQPDPVRSQLQFMVPHMVTLFLSLALIIFGMQVAVADQCQDSACINVYTDNNQIIIEARKGNTTVKKTIAQSPKKTRLPKSQRSQKTTQRPLKYNTKIPDAD